MTETEYGLTLIVADCKESPARVLKRIPFDKSKDDNGFQERWLQKLVSQYPSVLPIQQIEPALTPAIPVCMELPLKSGCADNLYVTPEGGLIVVETKLFRNPEARREVVGQIIDYAKDLSSLSYQQLEEAILKAEAPDGRGGHPSTGLYGLVASVDEEICEEQFIDAVSRNLERGRFLLLIIGDGIKEGTENIAAFLQQHAGMHFTLGLVSLAVFEMPCETGGYLVQPRILARTTNIERGIVTIENGRIGVKPSSDESGSSKSVAKRTTISEETYYEELAAHFPGVVPQLKAFTERLEEIGVGVEFSNSSIVFRWRPDEGRSWNLATIPTWGVVWADYLNMAADAVGLINLSHTYLKRLASLVPGAYVKETPKPTGWYVRKGETNVTIDELLAHEDGWLAAMQEFMTAASDALKDQ
jgi:hypothetical protein